MEREAVALPTCCRSQSQPEAVPLRGMGPMIGWALLPPNPPPAQAQDIADQTRLPDRHWRPIPGSHESTRACADQSARRHVMHAAKTSAMGVPVHMMRHCIMHRDPSTGIWAHDAVLTPTLQGHGGWEVEGRHAHPLLCDSYHGQGIQRSGLVQAQNHILPRCMQSHQCMLSTSTTCGALQCE